MRVFLILPIVIGFLVWAALQVPTDRVQFRVLRNALFIAAALFAALLLSAMVQALIGVD